MEKRHFLWLKLRFCLFDVFCGRSVIDEAAKVLRNAAGNYYVNDKSTGSVVAQQPFGGARASGQSPTDVMLVEGLMISPINNLIHDQSLLSSLCLQHVLIS